ncbi:Spy/CpxP family protein refolding chaperone [Sphingomonas sp. PB2P12]|uniref:Spy/CpxP family protein refolding chaperone n=1 Tax=Sphingomonas sandaracina TaxID=3096157 RepID=UPI002FCBDC7B
MKTRLRCPGSARLAMLAAMLGMSHAALAQGPRDGPPPRIDVARMQAREVDDMALVLALRPDQRPALAAFVQSMAPPPLPLRGGDRGQDRGDDAGPDESFTRRLDRMAQDSARRSEEDGRRITAARTFYASLDPAQRPTFEALMRLRHRPGPLGQMHGRDGGPPLPPPGEMPPPRP